MPVDKITLASQTKAIFGEIPVYGQYTYGLAGEKFFRAIKDNGKLLAAKCNNCNLIYLPPRIYCERCFDELKDWVEAPNIGTVHTFCLANRDLAGNVLEKPIVVAMVKIEGFHGGLVHFMGEIEPEAVKIGMPIEIVFKPKNLRIGSIADIKYFRPLKK
jgi:uncharacterized OB-fold protein